jgi:hypothetical protein
MGLTNGFDYARYAKIRRSAASLQRAVDQGHQFFGTAILKRGPSASFMPGENATGNAGLAGATGEAIPCQFFKEAVEEAKPASLARPDLPISITTPSTSPCGNFPSTRWGFRASQQNNHVDRRESGNGDFRPAKLHYGSSVYQTHI